MAMAAWACVLLMAAGAAAAAAAAAEGEVELSPEEAEQRVRGARIAWQHVNAHPMCAMTRRAPRPQPPSPHTHKECNCG